MHSTERYSAALGAHLPDDGRDYSAAVNQMR